MKVGGKQVKLKEEEDQEEEGEEKLMQQMENLPETCKLNKMKGMTKLTFIHSLE